MKETYSLELHNFLSAVRSDENQITLIQGEVTGDSICSDIVYDSRNVRPGALFFAVPGFESDGFDFIPQAIERGATALVVDQNRAEDIDSLDLPKNFIVIGVSSVRKSLARASCLFYKNPTDPQTSHGGELKAVGVTGTNGKTSTAWILCQLLCDDNTLTAYIGTLGVYMCSATKGIQKIKNQELTSPDPISVQRNLAEMKELGVTTVFIEVTSVALDQYRTWGVHWTGAIFTNLTQDHLDYHHTMERYGECKKLLFSPELVLSKADNKFAVINYDDSFGKTLLNEYRTSKEFRTVSFSRTSQSAESTFLYAEKIGEEGEMEMSVALDNNEVSFKTSISGSFMAENIAASISAAYCMGLELSIVAGRMPSVCNVPGRLQRVDACLPRVFVDYSHTPDSLSRAQDAILEMLSGTDGRLITVFGCGGDRDRSKRPVMGRSVYERAHLGIATSDNPRTEDPFLILEDIEPGLQGTRENFSYLLIEDRAEAIATAISNARENDIVLIAGKGHEDYQDRNGVKINFDDVVVARKCFTQAA